MQTNELSNELLRRLADFRPDGARVLSLFLNLDPSQFGTARARATEINSLVDQADRCVRDAAGLDHGQEVALREDVERARRFLNGTDFEGAHGLALYLCGPADLFEPIKLPRPIETRVCLNDSPFVEPLAELATRGSWCILLVNRQVTRMLRGARERLDELPPVTDEGHGQHDLGAGGRAVVGIEDTIEALNERRVGTLLVVDGLTAPGVFCRSCGWVGVQNLKRCPADGGALERRDDVVESAIELAILQSAEVLVSRHYRDELERRGGIGAVLRF